MKKNIPMLVAIIMLIPAITWAQAKVQNHTTSKVVISYGGQEYVANPSQTINCANFPTNGSVTFEAWHYQGFCKVSLGKLTREVQSGKMVIDQLDQKSLVPKKKVSDKSQSIQETSGDWWSTTTVTPVNRSTHRFLVPAPPFRGLALRPGQTSEKSVTLKTGEYVFPVYYDSDQEGESSGRNFKWVVLDKIVTEGQEEVVFEDKDFTEIQSGKSIKKPLRNNLPIDFFIVGGINQGKVISAKAYIKLQFTVGWNVIPIQYKDDNGLPIQAILLLMVNDIGRPMSASEKSGHTDLSIERDNIIIR